MAAQKSAVVDLDGVVWLAGEPLPGVDKAITLLREAGLQVVFATNNSSPTVSDLQQRLNRAGIETNPEDVVTAAHAAAFAVPEGARAFIVGEAGLEEAASARGLVGDEISPEAVVVGWRRAFDFDLIAAAATAIRTGAMFVATNDDPTHPTPTGLLPGTGALVAAIATAAEATPLVAGKPGDAMASLVGSRVNEVAVVIGDRPSTDGAFARRLGAPFGLVNSEATPADTGNVAYSASSLLGVVEAFLETMSG